MSRPSPRPNALPLSSRIFAIFLSWLMIFPAACTSWLVVTPPPPATPPAGKTPPPPGNNQPATLYKGEGSDSNDSSVGICKNPSAGATMADVKNARNEHADKWGDISVAQPKIWQFERVNSLLDGLLRDVEGISMADLVALDPSKQNAAAIRFIQSALAVGVQYDQAGPLNAQIAEQNAQLQQSAYQEQSQALANYNNYLQTLRSQEATLLVQQTAAQNQVNSLVAQLGATPPPTSDQVTAINAQIATLNTQIAGLQTQINSLNSSAASATPPSVSAALPGSNPIQSTSAPAQPATTQLSAFTDIMKSLPSGVQNGLNSALQSPSYPASKQMDNFITLLYERLAREVSALQDDIMRDSENMAYLVQFDVGLNPSGKTKRHMGRVEFTLNCPGCKVYSIYPGQSSYNIANYSGSSKRNSLWGNVATLIGLGISASYSRQEDTLQGSLVQSVYTAGFQNGTVTEGRERNGGDSQAGRWALQQFGWYYGSAPFEQYVSPGIRSTFALITMPKDLVQPLVDKATASSVSNPEICLPIEVRADWVLHDNPLFQKTWRPLPAEYVAGSRPPSSMLKETVTVKLPGAIEALDVPVAVARDPNQLHVLRMEYNTVYHDPQTPTVTGSGNSAAATPPAVVTPITTPTIPPAAPAPTPTPIPTPKTPPPVDSLSQCPKNECGAILLTLDQPIDPNLVITVNGRPLQRVRDWRGRATSILPAAQSGSDLAAPNIAAAGTPPPTGGGAAGAPTGGTGQAKQMQGQLMGTRSLLETDLYGPNTWFPVNSHEIILNIQHDLAGEEDFPVIQISDPARKTLTIPANLNEAFSEVLVNGFHLKPWTSKDLQKSLWKQYTPRSASDSFTIKSFKAVVDGLSAIDEMKSKLAKFSEPLSLQPGGPYAHATFLPLFLPDPQGQRFYAELGETGDELLINFAGSGTTNQQNQAKVRPQWLESRTQVILEDRDLDLAWSLSCYPQFPELVCQLPMNDIAATYQNVYAQCSPGTGSDAPRCPTLAIKWADWPVSRMVSTLEAWVEQYDPEGNYSFYSSAPIDLGPTPVDPKKAVGFQGWEFETVESTSDKPVSVKGCGYGLTTANPTVTFLGTLGTEQSKLRSSTSANCLAFDVPTTLLTKSDLVFKPDGSSTVMTIATSELRPYLDTPQIVAVPAGAASGNATGWQIEFPAGRVDCDDKLDFDAATKITSVWMSGNTPVTDCKSLTGTTHPNQTDWNSASRTGQIRLRVTIPRESLAYAFGPVHLLRGPDQIRVATLPNLGKYLLPSKLTLQFISNTQFVLRGSHAEAITDVNLAGPSTGTTVTVSTGPDFAAVTLSLIDPQTKKPTDPTSGVYTVTPFVLLDSTSKKSLPLEVTDTSGNPLTFTVPAPPKPASTNTGTAAACTISCGTVPCTVNCTSPCTTTCTAPCAAPCALPCGVTVKCTPPAAAVPPAGQGKN